MGYVVNPGNGRGKVACSLGNGLYDRYAIRQGNIEKTLAALFVLLGGLGIFDHLGIVRQPKLLHPGLAGNGCRLRKVHVTVIDGQVGLFVFAVGRLADQQIGVLCLLVSREINVRGSEVEEQIKAETDRLAAELEDKHYDV